MPPFQKQQARRARYHPEASPERPDRPLAACLLLFLQAVDLHGPLQRDPGERHASCDGARRRGSDDTTAHCGRRDPSSVKDKPPVLAPCASLGSHVQRLAHRQVKRLNVLRLWRLAPTPPFRNAQPFRGALDHSGRPLGSCQHRWGRSKREPGAFGAGWPRVVTIVTRDDPDGALP